MSIPASTNGVLKIDILPNAAPAGKYITPFFAIAGTIDFQKTALGKNDLGFCHSDRDAPLVDEIPTVLRVTGSHLFFNSRMVPQRNGNVRLLRSDNNCASLAVLIFDTPSAQPANRTSV